MRHTRGNTLLELVIVLAMTGLLLGIVGPPAAAMMDRAAVRAAGDDLVTWFARARREALARRRPVWLVLDTLHRRALLRVPGVGTRTRPLGSIYGVTLSVTRDSMAYDARGFGYGAANLTVVLSRGRVNESVIVSRLGRVRRQ
ncbi:MAG TPA: GspH/FimT family pseudopilin [Gemmatimonadaceae bacterium]|jgi:hypothetical protein|nr:GspH/FimT family pseudopilin [Gemmatimonadaceae bacterium]